MEMIHAEKEAKHLVAIQINGTSLEIAKGKHAVSELKSLGGVPQAHELALVESGEVNPLADGAEVKIKGGEEFVSYPRDSAAS